MKSGWAKEGYERPDVELILQQALRRLEKKHQQLLRWDVHERTLVSHLVCLLNGQFSRGLSVDMEYNREHGCAVKRNSSGATVYPDLIVHERGNDDNNLLVIECKKSNARKGEKTKAVEKLAEHQRKRKYKYAAFIVLEIGKERTHCKGWEICWMCEPTCWDCPQTSEIV